MRKLKRQTNLFNYQKRKGAARIRVKSEKELTEKDVEKNKNKTITIKLFLNFLLTSDNFIYSNFKSVESGVPVASTSMVQLGIIP